MRARSCGGPFACATENVRNRRAVQSSELRRYAAPTHSRRLLSCQHTCEEPSAQSACTGKIYALSYDRDDRLIIALDPSFVLDGTTMERPPADEEEPALWLYRSWQRSFELDPTVSADVVVAFNGNQATAPIRGIACE